MTANSNPNRMFLVIGTLIAAVLIGLAVFAVQGGVQALEQVGKAKAAALALARL